MQCLAPPYARTVANMMPAGLICVAERMPDQVNVIAIVPEERMRNRVDK
jgi:hypothetical protein